MRAIGAFFFLLLLAGAIFGGAGWWAWRDLHTQILHNQASAPVEIARGESVEQIISDLASKNIIDNPLPLRLYLKLKHLNPVVKAGNYYFPSPISPLEALHRLEKGGEFNRLTVIEGWTRWDIADAMTRIPSLGVQTRDQALALLNDPSLIRDIDPDAQSLEGYLFPDTYFIVSNSKAPELVRDMVKRFHTVWNETLKPLAVARNLTPHQIVTAASIIETEAKLKSERRLVASVIENRMHKNMPLSMDSTVIYASKLAGAWKNNGIVYKSDVDRNSPYNTRKYAGLPPGPVGSPGLSSLQAAVDPAATDFIYYVRNPARNDGAHNFYSDEKDFEIGVQALRAWEAQHPSDHR